MEKVDFGKAIEALENGKRVARSGWNGKGMFIFRQVPSEVKVYPDNTIFGWVASPSDVLEKDWIVLD